MTLLSRLLGFVRDVIIARFFGADSGTDAFFVAFKIPNFLRRLFAEGAFSQAFIPVLAEYKEKGAEEALKLFIDRTAGTLALALFCVSIIGAAAAPVLIMLFAPGFQVSGGDFDLSVSMLRLTFPYLFFISLTAFAGSLLNSWGRFAVPAFTPVFLNVCLISAAIWLAPLMDEPIMALAWGVLLAGIVQLAFQFPALKRLGLLPKPKIALSDPGVRKILTLMLPAIFAVSITQINLLLDTLIASFLQPGSITWLYYSDRLVEFPLGIFGIALATVILPSLSKDHAVKDSESFSSSLDWGLRLVFLIGVPAAIGLFMLGGPMLATLFQYDAFSENDVRMAEMSLRAFSFGLLAFILVKILVPGYTARQDTKTPVRIGVIAMISNMVMNLILVFPLAHAGLALATALAAYLNAGLLLKGLREQNIYRPRLGWGLFLVKVAVACGFMALVLMQVELLSQWLEWSVGERSLRLLFWLVIGFMSYLVGLLVMGIRPAQLIKKPAVH
jgi:putative peptidoglycan lipid II flippase